jgi:hypothetical protein
MSRHVLDELFDDAVHQQLRMWRMAHEKVGAGFGQSGWLDEQILSALHGSRKTFHIRDQGHFKRGHCHPSYCLVCYDVPAQDTPLYIRRLLRHPLFGTHAKRMGKVIKVTPGRIVLGGPRDQETISDLEMNESR